MKKILLGIFVLGIMKLSAQYDAKAKQILDNVSTKTKSYSTIKVDYLLTHENIQENIKESSQGTLELKGSKYKLGFMGNTIFCDAKTVWTFMKSANEVNISTVEVGGEDVFNPATMLTIYEKGFKYKFIQERFEAGRALYVIDLFPEKVDKTSYSKIRLNIDKDKSQIVQLQYFSKDENRFIIDVKKFEPNVALNDALFVFDKTKYPGVEVVDLR
ncbi:MAG: outer membrane lipoprotein carrier protein LolA [Bacteroidales bacterium]|nr:outer membrane lipoprotein carrier protein LolA [Bacteroidales bacterium]